MMTAQQTPLPTGEHEVARVKDVVLHEPQLSKGRVRGRQTSMRHWARRHYDEVVLTNQRLVFVNNGERERQLSVDPRLANRAARELASQVGAFNLQRDQASRIQFLIKVEERHLLFRQVPLPRRLRLPLAMLVMMLSLFAFLSLGVFDAVIFFAELVLFTLGAPAPWDCLQLRIADAQHAKIYLRTSALASALAAGYRLEIQDRTSRASFLQALQPCVQQTAAVFEDKS